MDLELETMTNKELLSVLWKIERRLKDNYAGVIRVAHVTEEELDDLVRKHITQSTPLKGVGTLVDEVRRTAGHELLSEDLYFYIDNALDNGCPQRHQ